jgi:hypothetical protein
LEAKHGERAMYMVVADLLDSREPFALALGTALNFKVAALGYGRTLKRNDVNLKPPRLQISVCLGLVLSGAR